MCLAGCGDSPDGVDAALRAIRNGSAKADLQRYFDTHPQCAPVLFYDDETRLLDAGTDNKGAPALLAAGLIERAQPERSGQRRYYRPAPAARRWFRSNPGDAPVLCFARRRVQEVSLVPGPDYASLRYTFDLMDPAPWMLRPDMQEAFPAVIRSFGVVFAGSEPIHLDHGVPQTTLTYVDTLSHGFLNYEVDFEGYEMLPIGRPRSPDWKPPS